jgi:transposase
VSGFDPTLDPEPVLVRRLEVLTGVGGRRRWSPDDKARKRIRLGAPNVSLYSLAAARTEPNSVSYENYTE